SSGDPAGVLLARRFARLVGEGQGLREGELKGAQTVAQRAGVLVADLGGGGGDQAREGGDQLPRLGEVPVLPGLLVLGEAHLHRRGAHQVHAGGGDDLDRGDLGDVAQLVGADPLVVAVRGVVRVRGAVVGVLGHWGSFVLGPRPARTRCGGGGPRRAEGVAQPARGRDPVMSSPKSTRIAEGSVPIGTSKTRWTVPLPPPGIWVGLLLSAMCTRLAPRASGWVAPSADSSEIDSGVSGAARSPWLSISTVAMTNSPSGSTGLLRLPTLRTPASVLTVVISTSPIVALPPEAPSCGAAVPAGAAGSESPGSSEPRARKARMPPPTATARTSTATRTIAPMSSPRREPFASSGSCTF